MEYQSSVQASEASKGKGPLGLFGKSYGLFVAITIDGEHPLEREMPMVNYHFLDWLARHGDQCADLVLSFSAPMALRDRIEDAVTSLLAQDVPHHETIKRLTADILISDPATGEALQLGASLRTD